MLRSQLMLNARTGLRRCWQVLKHPTVFFGVTLIGLAFLIAMFKVEEEGRTHNLESLSDLSALATMVEQDVHRTTVELDRMLRFLRRSHERSNRTADWADLVQDDFTINARAVQIAVIDRSGMMITSSALLRPTKPVDLSDREHYRFHRTSTVDVLHVSRPVIGRASGKWSIQFTRRLTAADGSFDGVLVVSLDPDQAISIFDKFRALPGAGYALIGDDDIIRASGGTYANMIGRSWPEGTIVRDLPSRDASISLMAQTIEGMPRILAMKRVSGMPLSVAVSNRDAADNGVARATHPYYMLASAFTGMVLLAMLSSLRRQIAHVRSITKLAHDDQLTKLPNRLSFQTEIARAYEANQDLPSIALHLIDLDHFKAVNDTYGHPVGDDLLQAVAGRLESVVRQTDRVFRLGGDEFALIQLNCTSAAQAEAVASRICAVMAEPFLIAGNQLRIGASIGIASPSLELGDPTALLRAADMALYRSKASGRGRLAHYDSSLGAALLRRKRLEVDLASAITGQQLEVHYQPKVLLSSPQHIIGYEALVRWRHPVHGMMPPGEFIDIAEETGLIVSLGEWVIEQACRQFAGLGDATTVAVNCSSVQFSRSDVARSILAILERTGLEPHRLEIEITESTLMREEATIVRQLEAIRAEGIRISLDDFGTGYSSLAYIEKYPIDCIKIDRSFVAKLGKEVRADAITRTVVTLAGELGIMAVAEGIETDEQAMILRALGCQIGQGYLYGRPVPAASIWGHGGHGQGQAHEAVVANLAVPALIAG